MQAANSAHGAIAVICVCEQLEVWQDVSEAFANHAGFLLIRSSAGLDALVSLCARLGSAVLLIEPSFLDRHSAPAIRDFLAPGNIHIIVLAREEEMGDSFLRRGCVGIIAGKSTPDLYRKAAKAVADGEVWASRKTTSRLLKQELSNGKTQVLTRRQEEILKLISLGYSNQEIAGKLFISRETVRWHVRTLYSKLGVSDRKSASLQAFSQ